MKNLFRKVRVVHEPESCSYEVHFKSGFFSFWKYQCHYRYVLDGKPSLIHNEYTKEQAREYAITRAKEMANRTIEWEN